MNCWLSREIALIWEGAAEVGSVICTRGAWGDVCSEIFTEMTCYRCGTRLEGTVFDKNEVTAADRDVDPEANRS